ncbi:protein TolR [Pseudomonas sp. G11-1]|uniref:Tol-Pal system protein TolR n=1 Tax=Halopseudomonas bauzanensis TaxID=653930 RepID=A0A031MDR7_9GAMM|nr:MULTISPECIES: protein TolR [Halopseudomonas]MCO5786818.1 protein TolR [Pseudomonas sp. G11-1]MCO5790044.1 protein TolR [Pseudomonas sp. G11-2]EZQ17944.1 biopolymer transporter TolR [Halopseudomonas bauzanensis]WGK61811.1 protein TolR [Halopseudomonas sp. SMJS2]SER90476.1 Cell division and transport-associated protein TolR [Halopseudomonas bauzanensis]
MRPARRKLRPNAEMNVVPYIDVMLVLLVIFMVTAPMLTQGIQIELPKVASEALATDDPLNIVTLSIDDQGHYHWNEGDTVNTEQYSDSSSSLEEMRQRITALVAAKPDTQVFIRADRHADYGLVIEGMAALQQGGITRLGLITEAP